MPLSKKRPRVLPSATKPSRTSAQTAKTRAALAKAQRTPEKQRAKPNVRKQAGRMSRKTASRLLPLTRYVQNPIIAPRKEIAWEAWQTFNPSAVVLDNTVHFVYRAIGHDGLSRFGHAMSHDGFRVDERTTTCTYTHRLRSGFFAPFSYASGGSWGGAEDPRIVRVDDEDILYMTYTACDGGLGVGLTSISIKNFLHKLWKWRSPVMLSPRNEVHKNWVIFPKKIRGKYAILHSISPQVSIAYLDSLLLKKDIAIPSYYRGIERKDGWEAQIRGVGPSPVETAYGWLVLYHAVDKKDPDKYKVGAMILDRDDPARVLYRAKRPVLEPLAAHDGIGFKPGIIYASGAVVKDGMLLIYFGRADNFVGVAHAPLDEFMHHIIQEGASENLSQRHLLRA